MSVLTVKNWFGGMSDYVIGEDPTSFQLADNLYVDDYGKLNSRQGTTLDFTTSLARARVPASVNTRRIGLMIPQKTGTGNDFTIVKQVGEKLHYDNGSAMTELVGPASASAFALSSPITAETVFSYAEWNNHSFVTHESPYQKAVMLYNDSGGTLRLRTAGLPKVADTFTATGGSAANYIYAVVLKYSYTVGSISYVIRSAPQLKEFTNIGTTTPASSPAVTVGSIPVLANANGEHYDTATIKVEVYRTTHNGSVLYYVGEVTNGTTSLADTVSDNTLIENEPLYTMDGSVDNDRPPKCKYVHGTSDFVYYAHAVEVGPTGSDLELQPQRLYQSKRGNPNSVPGSFYVDMEEPIVGISSIRSVPIVFCANSIYRIDGYYDDLGRGGMIAKKISDRIGGAGHLSIVQSLEGIFFAGSDDFYFTDGYQVEGTSGGKQKIKASYKQLVNTALKRKRLCGAFDVNENRVLWACYNPKETAADNARMFVLDVSSKSMTTYSSGYDGTEPKANGTCSTNGTAITVADTTSFEAGDRFIFTGADSTVSNTNYIVSVDSATGVTISENAGVMSAVEYEVVEQSLTSHFFANFRPSSMLFADDKLWIGNQLGFTVWMNEDETSDPWFNPANVVMTPSAIYFNYDSAAMDMGVSEARKWVNQIIIKARPSPNLSANLSININFENDDDGNEYELEPISFAGFRLWGSLTYGDPLLWQRIRSLIDVKRRFPANNLRCSYRQIGLSLGYAVVYQSGTQSTVAVAAGPNAISKTITLTGDNWNTDIENLYLSLEGDEYTAEYKIIKQNSVTECVVLDVGNALATQSAKKWIMRGYPKNVLLNLLEYSLIYEVIGPSQLPYQGENAVTQ